MTSKPSSHTIGVAPESFATFGALLLYLRRRARMRQRDLAIAVGYSEAQIGRLENDQRLPDLAMVRAQFIPALELQDDPILAQRLIALAQVAHQSDPAAAEPSSSENPQPARWFDPDLPHYATPLFGREAEFARIAKLLARSQHRCITLLGQGGIGKTRLALEAARHHGAHFADGVYALSLAGIGSADLLGPTIAQALGLAAPQNGDVTSQLREHLHTKHVLLLLDNVEHLIEGAPLLARLLAAPNVWLLATSRERLQIRDEVVVEIKGLPLPEPPHAGAGDAAIELFYSAAGRTQPTDSIETAAVARICHLVEGLPLGIELAAAWARMLEVSEIEQELRQTLDFLHTTQRDMPARHRSLRAVFDHSWTLLGEGEQRALERLSVFRGSFSAEAAHAVLHTNRALFQSLQLLAALLDKSLLKRVEAPGATRYVLHEAVRQYAADHLRQDGIAAKAVAQAHSHFYLHMLHSYSADLRGPNQRNAIEALAAEDGNLHRALQTAAETGDIVLLRMVLPTLCLLIEWRNAIIAGIALLETAVIAPLRKQTSRDETAYRSVLALAVTYKGWLQFHVGQNEAALTHLQEASELANPTSDCLVLGDTLLFLGFVLGETGEFVRGRSLLHQSIRAYEQCGDEWRIARGLYRLAMLQHQSGSAVVARHLFAECLHRLQAVGDPRATAFALNRLAVIDAALGDTENAQQLLQQSLHSASAVRDERGMATALYYMGTLAQQRNDHATACYFFGESCQIFAAMHERSSVADINAQRAYSAIELGDLPGAHQWLQQAWHAVRQNDGTAATLTVLVAQAALDLATGESERGVEALALVLHHPAASQASRDRAATLLHRAEPHLTPYQFVAAQARGRSAKLEPFIL